MTDIKSAIYESIESLEKVIDEYKHILDHSLFYLDDFFDKIRNKIDIHREELLNKVHQFSHEMLLKLDTYYNECKLNLIQTDRIYPDKKRTIITSLDNSLVKTKNSARQIDEHNEIKSEEFLQSIEKSILDSKTRMKEFKIELFNEKACYFEPIYFEFDKDPFGSLYIVDEKLTLSKEMKCLKAFSNNFADDSGEIYDLSFEVYDDLYVIFGNNKGKIRFWNIQTSQCCVTFDAHLKSVYCLKLILKHILISGSRDTSIKIWDIKNKNKLISTIPNAHKSSVLELCYYEEKNILISGSEDKSIKLWCLSSLKCLHTLTGHTDMIIGLKMTLDNKLVSSAWDNSIKVWDLRKMTELHTIDHRHMAFIHFDVMSNNNLIVLTKPSGQMNYVKIWNTTDYTCIKSFYNINTIEAIAMKLLSDQYLLVVHENNDMDDEDNIRVFFYRIWDLETERCVKFFTGYYYPGSFYGIRLLPSRKLIFCTDQFIQVIGI